jgi:hypothetical protein
MEQFGDEICGDRLPPVGAGIADHVVVLTVLNPGDPSFVGHEKPCCRANVQFVSRGAETFATRPLPSVGITGLGLLHVYDYNNLRRPMGVELPAYVLHQTA